MTTYRALAIVDDVNTCDCCGKTDLKCTVAMESEDGEILHFGSVCATRHSGRNLPTIKREIADAEATKIDAAKREYAACLECAAYSAKLSEAHRAKIPTGKEFAVFCFDARQLARKAAADIAEKHGVHAYQIGG